MITMRYGRAFSVWIFVAAFAAVLIFYTNVYGNETPRRIISLAPNMTEIIYALGLGERLVGVTTYCTYPPEARLKPKVGGMSNPSLEAVVSLEPDMVVMNTDGNPKQFEHRLRKLGIQTYVFKARRISELPGSLRALGAALGVEGRAAALAAEIQAALESYAAGPRDRGRVLFVVWPEPLIVAGSNTLIDDALGLLGFTNVAADAISNYPKYSVEEALRQQPDIIFLGSGRGMDMEKLAEKLFKRLSNTPAIKSGRVYIVGDSLYRFGPRVVQGIKELDRLVKQGRLR